MMMIVKLQTIKNAILLPLKMTSLENGKKAMMTNKNNGLFGHFGDNLNRRGESVDFVKLDKKRNQSPGDGLVKDIIKAIEIEF
jgi:hypothetical protein